MRKLVLTLAAFAAFGLALPAMSSNPAEAREVIVIKKKHRDHGRHYGWYRGHHYGWTKHHRHHHRDHGATIIVR
jgi:hypothetical protein